MIVCAAGDTHGAVDRFYDSVLAFEQALDVTFAWVLHVGDLGVWPDTERADRATVRHGGPGDFPTWWAERRPAPRPTLFIKGNHEDVAWLDSRPDSEILPGLFYLRNGRRTEIADGHTVFFVTGIGGCYGPSDYSRPSASLQGYSRRHYTSDEIAAASAVGFADIVLVHDAPAGVPFRRRLRSGSPVSASAGLDKLLGTVQPRVCFFGHHHARFDVEVARVPCHGLNKVDRPGNLVAVDLHAEGRGYSILGEWPLPTEP